MGCRICAVMMAVALAGCADEAFSKFGGMEMGAGCSSSAECFAGEACLGGSCVAMCVSDASCGSNQVCMSGTCISGARQSQCVSDAECGVGDACVSGVCTPAGNTNISFGGLQDFGYFRRVLDQGVVPPNDILEPSGFFAEHHTPLPNPVCGERVCLQAMFAVMGNLIDGNNCSLVQLGLNSPLRPEDMERPDLTLAIVVDVSGSMSSAGKLDFVRQGLNQMIDALLDGDQIALITYATDVETLFPMGPLAGNRATLRGLVNGLTAGGSTNIYAGLEEGYLQVQAAYDSGRQHRVIMLSDGLASAGNTNTQDILDMSAGYNSDGIGVTTVGLGTSFNHDLMAGLALQGDGNSYFVEDSSAVDEVFAEELSYFTVPVAFDIRMELRVGPDYAFGRAMGSPYWEDVPGGGDVEIPSVFLAHRESHSDVTGPGSERRGGGSMLLVEAMPEGPFVDGAEEVVATVNLQFREPGTDAIITDSIDVLNPDSAEVTPATGFFDGAIVEKSFVVMNIYVAIEQAVFFFHGGMINDAVTLLSRVIAAAADYEDSANGGEGDVDIQLDIDLMNQLIDVMQQNGAGEPDVSEFPDDPWPAD